MRSAPALFLLLAAPAGAAGLGAAGQPPEGKVEHLLIYGDDPCPKSNDGTIMVCARRPESERYRIPKKLRASEQPARPGGPGWASQVATLEATSRQFIPNSCSAIGSGGQTGCTLEQLRQWYAERQLDRAEAALP